MSPPPDRERPRRFQRRKLAASLDSKVFDQIVAETRSFLDRRFAQAESFQDIADTNFNPFLLLITAPVYNIFSPLEVAERLQLAKAFHGDDTAFGKFGEDKLLPLFGAKEPAEKRAGREAWEPIDKELLAEGCRYLISVKAGPWTMNQSHANAMIDKFPAIHKETNCPVMIGVMYGRYKNLNNKPGLVDDSLQNPEWEI